MLADSQKRTSVTLGHSESQSQESPNFIEQLGTSALPGAVLPATSAISGTNLQETWAPQEEEEIEVFGSGLGGGSHSC